MNFEQWCEKFDLFPCRITREWWNAALATEREACALIALEHGRNHDDHGWSTCGHEIGLAIRARRTS
jgi:hypothetical protein